MEATLRMTGPLDPRSAWTAGDRCPIACSLRRGQHPLGVPDPARGVLRDHPVRRLRRACGHQRARRRGPATASSSDAGLLEREDYRDPGQRTRQGYKPDREGRATCFPALAALMQWGSRWLDERGGPVVLRQHRLWRGRAESSCGAVAGHRVEPARTFIVSRRAGQLGRERGRAGRHAFCSAVYPWFWSQVKGCERSSRCGFAEFGLLVSSGPDSPLTDGVPGAAEKLGSPWGLVACGYVPK